MSPLEGLLAMLGAACGCPKCTEIRKADKAKGSPPSGDAPPAESPFVAELSKALKDSGMEVIEGQRKRIAELDQDKAAMASEVQLLKKELSERDAEPKQFREEIGRLHDELAEAKRLADLKATAVRHLMSGKLAERAAEAALKAVRGDA